MKNDIQNREDIKYLVDTFYSKVQLNALLSPIFNDVAKVNWEEHLPKMYDFWAGIILGETGFQGNPMQKHLSLSRITTFSSEHFDTWLALFNGTIDENFEGNNADEAKYRAGNIARLMLFKIQNLKT